MGDFNIAINTNLDRDHEERHTPEHTDNRKLRDAIDNEQVIDVFRNSHPKHSRIDLVIADPIAACNITDCEIDEFMPGASDHAPIRCTINLQQPIYTAKPIKLPELKIKRFKTDNFTTTGR